MSATDWVLLDGALLHGSAEVEQLIASGGVHAIYADLGDAAAAVGPLLLRPEDHAENVLSALAKRQRYACATLVCAEPVDALLQHLRDLREIASDSATYYFRYADHRALDAVTAVLSHEQERALLGPIQCWRYTTREGANRQLRPFPTAEGIPALPLRLDPSQWHKLLQAVRAGELFEATLPLAQDAQPPCYGNEAQRYLWTQETQRLLQRLGIHREPVRLLANLAMWQTAGQLRDEPVFHHTLEDAQRDGRTERLISLGKLGMFKGAPW